MSTHLSERSAHGSRFALGLLACFTLAACQSRTDVSTGANVPAQYAHVWVTLTQVAFNTSATAGPTDSGWQKFTLASPQTIDLTAVTHGTLSEFASSLSLATGTYNQIRLVLADSNTSLASSAQSAGALYNDEVDTTGSSGALERLPLAVPNAAQGITFAINLTIETAQKAALAAFACGQSSTSGLQTGTSTASTCESGTETASQCTAGTLFDSILGTCIAFGNTTDTVTGTASTSQCALGTTFDSSTGACISTGTTTTSENCASNQVFDPTTGTCESSGLGGAETTSAAIDFDASRDLVPYTISGQSGFLLIPHLSGYNLAQAGTIEGQIDISALPSTSGGVEVTAETPSSDGTRNTIVESTPLQSNGDFVLYPLPCAASSSSSSSSSSSGSTSGSCASSTQNYDLVIHGPGIETVIIQSVPVSAASPSSATALSLSGVTLTAATSYPVDLSAAVSPPGAWVGFYQTLPDSSSVSLPYLIEARPIDPFTGTFDTTQSLSAASLEYEVYAAGGSVALTPVTPSQGTSTYTVAASAPLYGNGPLITTVSPASGSATATFTAAAIALPSGTTAETISGTVTVSSPGKYDKGELILTQDGALIAVTPLDAYLGGSSSNTTLFTSVPGGTSTSIYYAEAWVWNASNPAGSLSRQPQSAPINLSTGSASGVAITIN